ncbi:MAG: glycosyltransferase family 9 protein [Chitinophagaceae bacterium]
MNAKHILVIRLSAMGDVAMTVPVLQQLLQQYPEIKLTVLTQKHFIPLFEPLERTDVIAADIKGKHKGITGLFKLFSDLKKQYKFDAVADLHNVLRSKFLRSVFWLSGFSVAKINKGRKEKKELTRKKNKTLHQLKTTFERYVEVFTSLNLPIKLDSTKQIFKKQSLPPDAAALFAPGKKNICIVPFAKHREKLYPVDKMKAAIQQFLQQSHLKIFLLGGGQKEIELLNQWEKELPGIVNLAGKFSFKDELSIISNMDAMISMDSANMHLASLFGVPVISVWGATHPFLGFYGWNQSIDNAVQIDLYCRPCSVFGNKPCYRGDHACMEQLEEKLIVDRLVQVNNSK